MLQLLNIFWRIKEEGEALKSVAIFFRTYVFVAENVTYLNEACSVATKSGILRLLIVQA